GNRAHDLPALAVSALHDVQRDPLVLHGATKRISGNGLDGDDRTVADERNGHHTRARGHAVEMHGASAAGADAASVLGTGHLQLFAQYPKQWSAGIHGDLLRYAVHVDFVGFHDAPPVSEFAGMAFRPRPTCEWPRRIPPVCAPAAARTPPRFGGRAGLPRVRA